jgi:enoyl-[acyl-carrier-protein] reductase (NADH)
MVTSPDIQAVLGPSRRTENAVEAVAFFASECSSRWTGNVLKVDGGVTHSRSRCH